MVYFLSLILVGASPVQAKPRILSSNIQKVPSIETVVEAEGFTPTPSQSEIYEPGSVLVPNSRGGHDKVVGGCIAAEPDVAVMSQSSIATSLSAGVSARLIAARGAVAAGVEKRLSFVDPEQRTIDLAKLDPTEACTHAVAKAGRFIDLTQAIVLYDVLVAQIQNSVCTKAAADGSVMLLGVAEASAYSECIQESDAQVPLGYKAVPLSKVLAASGDPAPQASTQPGATNGSSNAIGGDFDATSVVAQIKAAKALEAKLHGELNACLTAESAALLKQASADWADLADLAALTDSAARAKGKPLMDRYVATYDTAKVTCRNALGERSRRITVPEVDLARYWLAPPATTATVPASPVIQSTTLKSLPLTLVDTVLRNDKGIKVCFQAEKGRTGDYPKRVAVRFTIRPDGRVSSAQVSTAQYKGTAIDACLNQAFRGLAFPSFEGNSMTMTYPFVL